MSNKEKKNELPLIGRDLIKYFMKKISLKIPIIIGFSLLTLTCQNSTQLDDKSNVSSASINTSNSASRSPGSDVPTAPQTNLKIGDKAPDFTLTDTNGQPVKLSDFRGKKNVILAFYVMAFTGG